MVEADMTPEVDAALHSVGFLDELRGFYRRRSEEFKVPIFNKREMDLEKLWKLVQEHGGSEQVCTEKRWASIGRFFDPPRSMTNLSFHIKRIYEKCLLAYERECHPGRAMSKENEQPSAGNKRGYQGELGGFLGRSIKVPTKRRSNIRRSQSLGHKPKKQCWGSRPSTADAASERSLGWCWKEEEDRKEDRLDLNDLHADDLEQEPSESPSNRIPTPDWLKGGVFDDEYYRRLEQNQSDNDEVEEEEIVAATALSNMRFATTADQSSPSKQDAGARASSKTPGPDTEEGPSRGLHDRHMDAVVNRGRSASVPHVVHSVLVREDKKSREAAARLGTVVREPSIGPPKASNHKTEELPPAYRSLNVYHSTVMQVAPKSGAFVPPAPVVASQPVATLTSIYENEIEHLKQEHSKELTQLRQLLDQERRKLMEQEARLKATEASAMECRRCFQMLLDQVKPTERNINTVGNLPAVLGRDMAKQMGI